MDHQRFLQKATKTLCHSEPGASPVRNLLSFPAPRTRNSAKLAWNGHSCPRTGFRRVPIQAQFWLEWDSRLGMFNLPNSVIPTGADHRESADLWSGGTCCFLALEGRVEIKSERKRERAAERLSSRRTVPLKPKSSLNGPPAKEEFRRIIRDTGFRPAQRDTLYRQYFLN